MSISNYAELKSAIIAFALRDGDEEFEAQVGSFVALANARLNRVLRLRVMEDDAPLTGTIGSRFIPLPDKCQEAVTLYLTTFGSYIELRNDVAGEMPICTTNGTPNAWAVDNQNTIKLDTPCDREHTFQLRYRKSFELSADEDTNWLLTNYPDLYLAACLIWGNVFSLNYEAASPWKQILDEGIAELNWLESRNNRGRLTVDPALASGDGYNIFSG